MCTYTCRHTLTHSLNKMHTYSIRYFTVPTERSTVITSGIVFRAYAIVLRFHLGTAAFGGLIIALVQFARFFYHFSPSILSLLFFDFDFDETPCAYSRKNKKINSVMQ